jgi:hypothetical protein
MLGKFTLADGLAADEYVLHAATLASPTDKPRETHYTVTAVGCRHARVSLAAKRSANSAG